MMKFTISIYSLNFNFHLHFRIPAELKYVVYCSSFETSKDKEETWNKLWEIYKYSQIMSEKELVLSSLACVNDVTLYKK